MFARALLPLVLIVALVGTAAADKAKLAVLGLEVAGSIDNDSTSRGRLLTEKFRERVGISPRFSLAANSIKDLLDEKVANGCDSEAPDCMAKIGSKLKAQLLIFGKIEKRPKDGREGYQVSMKALDVDKKTSKEWSDWIPLSDFADNNLDARLGHGFDVLVGNPITDTVITTKPIGPPPTPKKPGGGFPWKTTAYAATGVAMVSFAGFIYTGLKTRSLQSECHTIDKDRPLDAESSYAPGMTGQYTPAECAKGPKYSNLSYVTGIAAGAIGAFALVAYYEGFVSKKSESSNPTAGRSTRKKKHLAVTPILSPDGAGATVRLDW